MAKMKFFATAAFPLERGQACYSSRASRINPSIPGRLLLDRSLSHTLALMTAVLLHTEYVVAASPYGNLSRKAINSNRFSHVNLVYLYS